MTEVATANIQEETRFANSLGYLHLDFDAASIARLTRLEGWAFYDGAKHVLEHINDLPRNYVWLTNLEPLEHKALVDPRYTNIKHNRFLPMTLEQMRIELGLLDCDNEKFANVLVRLGDNLLRLCQHTYKGNFLSDLLLQPTFAQAISATIGMNALQQPQREDELHTRIIWENVQEKTFLKKANPALPLVCFRVPMYRHTNALMSCPLPSETQPWREVNVPTSSVNDFFARDDIPCVVQIKSIKLPTQLEGIYPTHNGSRYSHREMWLPGPEVSFLRNIAHVDIGRVFIQPAGYCKDTPWRNTVPNVKSMLQLSYSAQMMCHAHFLSAAMPVTERYWPMHAWWVRSMDRMLMAFAVMPIAAIEGIDLISYGEGCAFFQGSPHAIATAIEMAPHLQLSPTQSAWAACDLERAVEIEGNPHWCPDEAGGTAYTVYEKNAMALSRKGIGLTLQLDDACLMALASEEDALQAITQIMRGLKHGKNY